MVEIDGILKRIIEGLATKEWKTLDKAILGWGNTKIGKELGYSPGVIGQVFHNLYWKFGLAIDFEGQDKRATLILVWQEIRERDEVKPISELQEQNMVKPVSEQGS